MLIGIATSESIQARHYCGQPITDIDVEGPVEARPHTTADRCVFKSAANRYSVDEDKDVTECRHSFVSGSHGCQQTGGIFTRFCRHGICYGVSIISNAEGRNEAFSFLL